MRSVIRADRGVTVVEICGATSPSTWTCSATTDYYVDDDDTAKSCDADDDANDKTDDEDS